jgi:hypothetical protein
MSPRTLDMAFLVNVVQTKFRRHYKRGSREFLLIELVRTGLQTRLHVAPQILIVLFFIYLFDNIIQLISLRSLWYYGGW